MPAYGTFATLPFTNNLQELIEIVFDQLNYVGPSAQLTPSDNCLEMKCVVGDENKFNAICGLEVTIKFMIQPGSLIDIASFIAPQDNYIRVTVFKDKNYTEPEFQGFVMVEDNSQPFLDPPFEVTIKATDGLGTLQGVYFLDQSGNTFQGKQTIIGWLAQILAQTNTTLHLRTYFNIFNVIHVTSMNPLEQICLDAQAFQTGQQTPVGDTNPADFNTGFDDYYTVLTKIVKNFRCKIFQEAGYWHLMNLWDYENPVGVTYYEYVFGAPVNGIVPYTLVTRASNIDQSVPIGKNNNLRLVQEDAVLYLKVQKKSVELTYNYNQSINKVLNQDLGQGVAQPAQNEVISSTIIDPAYNKGVAVNLNTYAFTDAYWSNFVSTLGGPGSTIQPSNAVPADPSQCFIRVVDDILGNEMIRFLVIKNIADPQINYVQSTQILLDSSDILQISFSWRTRTGTGIANQSWGLLTVLLKGDDGTFWVMVSQKNGTIPNNPVVWQQVNANWQNSFGNVLTCDSEDTPSTLSWNVFNANTQALPGVPFATAPVSGEVFFIINRAGSAGTEFWFKDFSIKILPYLNGSYQQLQGDYNYAESNEPILATILETVDISDSPKRYFQGALLSNAAGYVLLAASWYRFGYAEALRFTEIMVFLYYTNVYRITQKIEGSVQRTTINNANPNSPIGMTTVGMRNYYFFVDGRWPTKRFMLCSYDRDYNTGIWRGVFCELNVDQTDPGLKTPDFYEFSYLFTGLNP